jgi:hypothetical protein
MFNVSNVNNLFLGLYFCQSPLAQRKVRAAASHLPPSSSSSSSARVNNLTTRASALSRDIQAALVDGRIASAVERAHTCREKEGARDTLRYLKNLVVKDGLRKMTQKGTNNPLLGGRAAGRRANSPNGGGGGRAKLIGDAKARSNTPPPSSSSSSGGRGVHNPADRNSGSFIAKKRILESVTNYRKTMQNYNPPPKLIHLSSYSQLDLNSIFASQLRYIIYVTCMHTHRHTHTQTHTHTLTHTHTVTQ